MSLSDDKKITRRNYLKYAGGIVAASALAAAGYGISQYYKPSIPTTTSPTMTTRTSDGKKKVRIGGTKPLTGSAARARVAKAPLRYPMTKWSTIK